MGLRALDRCSDRISCRKCWESTLRLKSLVFTLFIVFITVAFDHSSLGENRVEEKNKTSQTTPSQNCGRGRQGSWENTQVHMAFKKICTCFSQTSWQTIQRKVLFFLEMLRMESICKRVDRSFLGSIAWRPCQPSFQTFEQRENRYCALKSSLEILTPYKFCMCPRNGRSNIHLLCMQNWCFHTKLLYNRVPGATLRCNRTRVPVWTAETSAGRCPLQIPKWGPVFPSSPGSAFGELIHCMRLPGDLPLTPWLPWSLHPWFSFLVFNLLETVTEI